MVISTVRGENGLAVKLSATRCIFSEEVLNVQEIVGQTTGVRSAEEAGPGPTISQTHPETPSHRMPATSWGLVSLEEKGPHRSQAPRLAKAGPSELSKCLINHQKTLNRIVGGTRAHPGKPSRLKPQGCLSLALCTWTSYLTSLSPSAPAIRWEAILLRASRTTEHHAHPTTST